MIINPLFAKDMYKVGHHRMYPEGTTLLFSNFTPRRSRLPGIDHSVFFGLKYFLKMYLQEYFNHYVFSQDPYSLAIGYQYIIDHTLGEQPEAKHMSDLVKLGHLPIAIHALPEGAIVPCGVPALVMYNTHPDFFWLPNMLETLISCTLWGACTAATIARQNRLILDGFARLTSDIPEFVDYQAHDFSMRGMFGLEASILAGLAHLHYFKGSDSMPAILANERYYDNPINISSVPATEHSVMSAYGKENELECYRHLITEVHPEGMISIVSDTYDLWNVIENYLPALRDEILNRDGTVIIRPDSGDPVDILCGYDLVRWRSMGRGYINLQNGKSDDDSPSRKGLIECLWDIFGGHINTKGYKQLDPHIGVIYGDSITTDRCRDICQRLQDKGFASTNCVFGVGSYSYQYHTRDSLGWAMKTTYAEINGKGVAIYKDPITDDGTKRSHRGLLKVVNVEGAHGSTYQVLENQTWEQFRQDDNELQLVFEDGRLV